MKTKKCTKCGIEKPLDAEHYWRDSIKPSGFVPSCKVCRNKQKVEHYQNNKEKILKRKAEYNSRPEVKERISKQKAEYRSRPEVKERMSKYNTEHYQNNKEEQPACVYQIVNSVNDKIYIGETTRGELRWKEHLKNLRGKYHANHKLQADFNKFGEAAFEWSIIKEYPKDKDTLLLEEARTIVKYRKEGKDLYNLTLTIDQVQLLEENK